MDSNNDIMIDIDPMTMTKKNKMMSNHTNNTSKVNSLWH